MKKQFFILMFLLLMFETFAQVKPKAKTSSKQSQFSQSQTDKLLEDAMKAEGMSKEEIEATKKMMNEGKELSKQTGFTGQIPGNTSIPDLSTRQTKILNSIPVFVSKEQYNTYLQTLLQLMMQKADKKIITAVNSAIEKNKAKSEALCNLPAIYLYNGNATATLYSAIKVAMMNPGLMLFQNNLAAVLLQAGYPQKAIPVLQFLLKERSSSPLLNNLAQCYLSLGDTALARKYFILCLAKAPEHAEANCGMGYLEAAKGDIKKATPYLITSLRNGFSPLAFAILKKNKIKVTAHDIDNPRNTLPNYFDPDKYKPTDPANSLETRDSIEEVRGNQSAMINEWTNKSFKLNESHKTKNENQETRIAAEQAVNWLDNSPLSAKAQFVLPELEKELNDFGKEYNVAYLKAQKRHLALRSKLDELAETYKGNPNCKAEEAAINSYLQQTAIEYRLFVNKYKADIYDHYNKILFYSFYMYDERTYAQVFHSTINSFFGVLRSLNDLQPLYFATSRCGNKKVTYYKDTLIFEPFCPFSISASLVAAKLKFDCKSFEIEGGEGLVGSFEYDLKTGESTFGIGAGFNLEWGIFEAGVTEKMIFKFDSKHNLVDVGAEVELGVEAKIGPLIIDRNIKETITIESGVQGTYTDMITGHDVDFFPN